MQRHLFLPMSFILIASLLIGCNTGDSMEKEEAKITAKALNGVLSGVISSSTLKETTGRSITEARAAGGKNFYSATFGEVGISSVWGKVETEATCTLAKCAVELNIELSFNNFSFNSTYEDENGEEKNCTVFIKENSEVDLHLSFEVKNSGTSIRTTFLYKYGNDNDFIEVIITPAGKPSFQKRISFETVMKWTFSGSLSGKYEAYSVKSMVAGYRFLEKDFKKEWSFDLGNELISVLNAST